MTDGIGTNETNVPQPTNEVQNVAPGEVNPATGTPDIGTPAEMSPSPTANGIETQTINSAEVGTVEGVLNDSTDPVNGSNAG